MTDKMKRFSRAIILVLGTMLVCFSGLDAKDRSAKGVKLNYKSLNAKARKEYLKPEVPYSKRTHWINCAYASVQVLERFARMVGEL